MRALTTLCASDCISGFYGPRCWLAGLHKKVRVGPARCGSLEDYAIRVELFRSASLSGLATGGDALVSRRDTRKSPLRHKLADDITTLLHCLKNNSKVPRSLLKNGKHSADYLESSRQSELTSSQAFSTTASSPPPTPPPPAILPNDSVRLSAIMKDINLLRDDINDLKREVAHLNCQAQPSPHIDTCHIKVYFPSPCTPVLDPTAVSNLLGCPSLLVTHISPKSIKVKILKSCLYNALQSSDSTSHLVYIWKNRVNRPPSNTTMPPPSHSSSESIKITTWNCRGLLNSIPYIQHLISTGTDILVLQEHWLWPYELSELQSINPNYTYTAVSDSRLTPTSTLTRGCGGCAIIWKKTIPAVVMSNLESDRICGIKVPIKDTHSHHTRRLHTQL